MWFVRLPSHKSLPLRGTNSFQTPSFAVCPWSVEDFDQSVDAKDTGVGNKTIPIADIAVRIFLLE